MILVKNLIESIVSVILVYFGKKYDEYVIPHGLYCYAPDMEKNKNRKTDEFYYTIPCKYYKTISKNYNCCKYLGVITDDFIFNDQCKMCSVNDELDSTELEEIK